MNISEKFNVARIVGAVVGLELEIEGENLPGAVEGWRVVRDGSLRGGLEYVMDKPAGALKVKELLNNMQVAFDANKTVTNYSYRTSTHCHINVSNLDTDQVKTIILLYYMFETQYTQFCHKGRVGNRFCLRLQDAEAIIGQVKDFIAMNKLPTQDNGKYCALNMVPLGQYGTLEVRTLEGTKDWEKIHLWTRALIRLRKVGKEIGSIAALKEKTTEELGHALFGTPMLSRAFLKDGWENDVEYQKSLMLELFN